MQGHSDNLPHLFNICLHWAITFQDDNSSNILSTLYQLILKLLKFAETHLEFFSKNGAMKYILNSELLKMMIFAIDYDSDCSKFNNQMKLLLEIHMKLSDLQVQIEEKFSLKIDSNLENTQGILDVKRGKTVL